MPTSKPTGYSALTLPGSAQYWWRAVEAPHLVPLVRAVAREAKTRRRTDEAASGRKRDGLPLLWSTRHLLDGLDAWGWASAAGRCVACGDVITSNEAEEIDLDAALFRALDNDD